MEESEWIMETNRLEGFSDAVFAIAITLLVLEIKVPHSGVDVGSALLNLWPSYLAYAISFIVLGAIWINHHAMFKQIVRVDQLFLLINIFFLMFVAFLPFPTAVLAQALHDGIDQPLVTAFYGGTLAVIGILVNMKWRYAAYRHRLISKHMSNHEAKLYGYRLLVGPLAYGIAAMIALIAPWLALVIYVGINVFFLWPRDWHSTGSTSKQ